MPKNNLILIQQFCLHHQIEMTFIDAIQAQGLISVQVVDDDKYISDADLKELEKMVEFHFDLGINLEGIEVVHQLLIQNDSLRKKLEVAHQRLKQLGLLLEC